MLALHLLRNCMVDITTLMLEQVLAQPKRAAKLTSGARVESALRDLRALTLPIWDQVNPVQSLRI
jgi:hypothetical protein